MKQPKKLTRDIKEKVYSHGLNVDQWMLVKETEFYLYLISKDGKQRKVIGNFKKRKGKAV